MSDSDTLPPPSTPAPRRRRVQAISLGEETERRYLNYALSVISSRALPDVRDGLKPVQRRILYCMHHNLKLSPAAKFRKSAAVVGQVMGKYHPHGDQAIYDAMVRMAQDFSLRYPLVEGYGNFGSIDGDKAAAMRYSEARLQQISLDLLEELKQQTVDYQPNFDSTENEPTVLPARFPHLLVNGSSGIAVGMATNIPPHNLHEVMDALLFLVDHPEADISQLLKLLKGPDFPTGGELTTPRKDRIAIYEKGQGSLLVRGTWKEEAVKSKKAKTRNLIINSIPYGIQKSTLIEKIADVIVSKKLAPLLDVRDESTEDIRIVLEIKTNTNPEMVMAYLFKNTPLEQRFAMNLTCLVPDPETGVCTPARLSIKEILQEFIRFRIEVLQRRFTFELNKLLKRIHILQGFRILADALDEVLELIRKAEGKKDAATKLLALLPLDEEQVEAILETKLYRLSHKEIRKLLDELEGCEKEAAHIQGILDDDHKLLDVLRRECMEIREKYTRERRTRIREKGVALEFDENDFLQHEDTFVILTKDGWIKRIKSFKSVEQIRVRENDEVFAILPGNTKETIGIATNQGSFYTIKIWDVPATTGYGSPLQTLFKFKDKEKVVSAFSFDPRICGDTKTPPVPEEKPDEKRMVFQLSGEVEPAKKKTTPAPLLPPRHLLVMTRGGMGLRISAENFEQPSTKNGRRCVRLGKDDEVLNVLLVCGTETVILATENARHLLFSVSEVKYLSSPGKGVQLMQLEKGDRLFAGTASGDSSKGLLLKSNKGENFLLCQESARISSRNGKGVKKRGASTWKEWIEGELEIPSLEEAKTPSQPSLPQVQETQAAPPPSDSTATPMTPTTSASVATPEPLPPPPAILSTPVSSSSPEESPLAKYGLSSFLKKREPAPSTNFALSSSDKSNVVELKSKTPEATEQEEIDPDLGKKPYSSSLASLWPLASKGPAASPKKESSKSLFSNESGGSFGFLDEEDE